MNQTLNLFIINLYWTQSVKKKKNITIDLKLDLKESQLITITMNLSSGGDVSS